MSLRGRIRVPSDKSISHRALLLAALAQGTSHLDNLLPSDDVRSTLAAIESLGAVADLTEGAHGLSGSVTGFGAAGPLPGPHTIDCGNSGTTTRLLLGVLAGLGVDATLSGDASLSKRPMERVLKPLRDMGARFETLGEREGYLPVRVLPRDDEALRSVDYTTEQASAQVKSAILLAGLFADGTTRVTEPAASRDHTERLLPAFGVPIAREGLAASLTGPASLVAHDMTAPADPSSAAFIAVAAALQSGSEVVIEQVALNPTRIGALEVLRTMGCDLTYVDRRMEGAEPVGDVVVRADAQLHGVTVPAVQIPALIDEIPVLSLAAAAAEGETVFERASELRVKESDRFAAVIDGMAALGVHAYAESDDLHIMGKGSTDVHVPERLAFPTYHDHRLAMTWYLAGSVFDFESELDDPDCVSVSWPGFYSDMSTLSV